MAHVLFILRLACRSGHALHLRLIPFLWCWLTQSVLHWLSHHTVSWLQPSGLIGLNVVLINLPIWSCGLSPLSIALQLRWRCWTYDGVTVHRGALRACACPPDRIWTTLDRMTLDTIWTLDRIWTPLRPAHWHGLSWTVYGLCDHQSWLVRLVHPWMSLRCSHAEVHA